MQELKRQWELKAMKRIVALSEARAGKHASSREVSKGAHHAILVAVDEASGELLGCVEVREMRGYLRPRELVDVPAQSVRPSCIHGRKLVGPNFQVDVSGT